MNLVADALSKRHDLTAMLETKLFGLDCIKELYEKNIDFGKSFSMCIHLDFGDFYRHNGFLFKANRLCVPKCSIRELLVRESHEGGLMGHFGVQKTLEILNKHFFCPHMRKDVHNICERCLTCKLAKSKVSPHSLYTSLSIPTTHWIDIFMDFVLDLPRSKGGRDSAFVVIDRFSKMAYFIPCHKTDDASHVTNCFSREVVRIHELPRINVPDKDTNFLSFLEVPMVLRDWEDWIPHVQFSYTMVFNSTTSHSPIELAYGFNPSSPLYLFPLPSLPTYVNDEGLSKAQFIKKLHQKARMHMEKKGETYAKNVNKGSKEVLFKEGTQDPNLRSSSLQKGEDDAYMRDYTQGHQGGLNKEANPTLEGPMTKGRLKRIQEEVQLKLATLRAKRRPKKAYLALGQSPFRFYIKLGLDCGSKGSSLWRLHTFSMDDYGSLTTRFSFMHDGQKVTLKPLSQKEVNEDQLKVKMKREKERKNQNTKREKRKKIMKKSIKCPKGVERPKRKKEKKIVWRARKS
ncbi:hypothetical protein CR513_43175, partial [Mucuna pruriens]